MENIQSVRFPISLMALSGKLGKIAKRYGGMLAREYPFLSEARAAEIAAAVLRDEFYRENTDFVAFLIETQNEDLYEKYYTISVSEILINATGTRTIIDDYEFLKAYGLYELIHYRG